LAPGGSNNPLNVGANTELETKQKHGLVARDMGRPICKAVCEPVMKSRFRSIFNGIWSVIPTISNLLRERLVCLHAVIVALCTMPTIPKLYVTGFNEQKLSQEQKAPASPSSRRVPSIKPDPDWCVGHTRRTVRSTKLSILPIEQFGKYQCPARHAHCRFIYHHVLSKSLNHSSSLGPTYLVFANGIAF
jgi:hypothetical protein